MGNLKTMFTNKFLESDLPVVFHNARWIKIIEAVCAMKMEYPGKNNINLVNPNQQAGKLFKIFEFYTCIYLNDFYDGVILFFFVFL